VPRKKRPRRSFWSLFHGFLQVSSTRAEPQSRRRRRPALPLALELLEDRSLLSAPPVLSVPQTTFDVVKTTQLSVTVTATDASPNQNLVFSLSGNPAGATITSTQENPPNGSKATGLLTWTPTPDQGPTSFPFTITVTDKSSQNKDSASQQITVNTEAVGLVGNNLLIVGTSGNDVVSIQATTAPNVISATVNGVTSGPFMVPTGGQILANLYGGNDTFTVNKGTQPVGPPVGPNVIVDGGTGVNSLTINGTPNNDAFTISSTTVGLAGAGSINYSNFQALAVNGLGGDDTLQVSGDFTGNLMFNSPGSLQQLSVAGTVTAGSRITATNISDVTIGTLAGAVIANGGSIIGANITQIAPGGLLQATEAPGVAGSGVIRNATIGTNSGSIFAGSIADMKVGKNAHGASIKVAGQGTTDNLSVGSNSGSITAVPDSNSGSGMMSNTTIGSNTSSGSVSAGSISGMSVTGNSGSITANEDPGVSGSGVISNASIGSNTSSGSVSAGSISGMSVASNSGSITAAGQGTINNLHVGTNTKSGHITAKEDSTPGSGVMTNTSIVTNSGKVFAGSIADMKVGKNAHGASIKVAGQGTTDNLSVGSNSGSITAVPDSNSGSGVMSNTTIGSNTSLGSVSAGSISGMSVTGNSGSITANEDPGVSGSGVISNASIGSNTSSGSVSAGSISGMSVTSNSGSITAAGQGIITKLHVGTNAGSIKAKEDSSEGSGTLDNIRIDTLTKKGAVSAANAGTMTVTTLAGSIQVTNTLDNLSAATLASTANLQAGHFNVVTAQHAAATVNFIEPTVTRTLTVSPRTGDAVPDYGFYYDGISADDPLGDPLVVVQINAASTLVPFDLGVTTNTATNGGNGFDLAGLYSVDSSGNHNVQTDIHNVMVGGNLLTGAVPKGAISFFKNLPANTPGGVQLPQDTVAVAVAGNLPAASIVAKAVPVLAASSFAGVSANSATHTDALVPLAKGTSLTQANDTFQVFVSEASPVAQFLVTGPGNSFDAKPMLFADQVFDNHPGTATDTLVRSRNSSTVSTVTFTGQGGSLTTAQPITTSITSTGSLGDLILSAPHGLTANVTAPSILGNIDVTNGGISGTIETSGDLGRTFTDANGNITSVTSIQTGGGGLTGQIIVGGNLISQVELKSGMDGVIAVQGDIGVMQTNSAGSRIRFGGITVSTGGVNGQIVAQGNVFGDINITGGLNGRIAVHGPSGILGNVLIGGGIGTTGAIVSRGEIGDATNGTQLSISGNDKGILAAEGDINGDINRLKNVFTGSNANVIDAIFLDNNGNRLLDVTDSDDLELLLLHLRNLKVGSNGQLTDTT
jgi:hypothetical protein